MATPATYISVGPVELSMICESKLPFLPLSLMFTAEMAEMTTVEVKFIFKVLVSVETLVLVSRAKNVALILV